MLRSYARSNRVYGVDRDQDILQHAKANGLITHCGLLEPLSFGGHFFDVISMIDSIEHTESRGRLIGEVKRTLKEGGTLLVITPCYRSCLWVFGEKVVNVVGKKRNQVTLARLTVSP